MSAFVKGQTLKSLLLFMQSTLAPAELDQALATLAPDERQQIERGILPTSTFPMSLVNRLTVEGARAANRPVQQFARDAGRFSASEAVKGVYRMFARVLTVEALLSKAASMWSSMNSAGKMQVEKGGEMDGRAAAQRLRRNRPDHVHAHRRLDGAACRAGRAKNAAVTHARCLSKGEQSCEWRITW